MQGTVVEWLIALQKRLLQTPLTCSDLWAPPCPSEIVPNLLSIIIVKLFFFFFAALRIELRQVEIYNQTLKFPLFL